MGVKEQGRLVKALLELNKNELSALRKALAELEGCCYASCCVEPQSELAEQIREALKEKVREIQRACWALDDKLQEITFGIIFDADWCLLRLHEKAKLECEISEAHEESITYRAKLEAWQEVLDFIETYYFEAAD